MTDNQGDPQQRAPLHRLGSTPRRRAALILLLVAGTYLLIPRLAGVTDAVKLMAEADARYLVLAAFFQLAAIVCTACVLYQTLPAVGTAVRFSSVLQVSLAAQFATMFVPSAGLSGLAIRVRYLSDWECNAEATLLTYALEMLGQGIATAIMIAIALLWLTLSGQGAPWWILALVMGTLLYGIVLLAILLASPHKGDWRYVLLERVNRVLSQQGRPLLPIADLEQRVGRVRQVLLTLSMSLRVRLLLTSMGRIALDVLCLQATLLAFGQALCLHLTIISHGLSSVVGYISSLPGGLFATEGSLSAILARQGVQVSLAVAATLTYRLFAFWLPRLLGLVTWWNLQRQSGRPLW